VSRFDDVYRRSRAQREEFWAEAAEAIRLDRVLAARTASLRARIEPPEESYPA
jgi:hypothetical protein